MQTPDGRALAVEDAGDPNGIPVMVHVGTPGCRRLYGRTVADAIDRGIRLISYDRPGYGDSTPHPGRTTADCALDVQVICAELGVERLTMWGLSGGGPHVLACAALLPDLVAAAASLCSLAPYDAEGLDWLSGFSQGAIDEANLMLSDEPAARTLFETDRDKMLAASPAELAQEMLTQAPDADLEFLTDEAISMQRAMAPGIEGGWDDCISQMTPWGFDVSQISIPMLLLHGGRDKAVPFSHGQWLAEHIPGVEAWFFPEEGHGMIRENHIGEVHAWLASRF